MKLIDLGTGQFSDLLVNEIGFFKGSVIVGVTGGFAHAAPGDYIFDLTADGNWEVTIEQPRITSAPSAPITFKGKGYGVAGPFTLTKGVTSVEMTHDGSSNFVVILYDNSGNRIDLLVNEIGEYNGSKAVRVTGGLGAAASGIHYLDIMADGNWEVAINQL